MTGLDTNVLVRYLTQDDPEQSKRASRWIHKHCTVKTPGYINCIVFCELLWVLETTYQYDRKMIAEVLEKILRTHEFVVEDCQAAWKALNEYRRKKSDFADSFLGEKNREAGCEVTVTFDKRAGRSPGFKLL